MRSIINVLVALAGGIAVIGAGCGDFEPALMLKVTPADAEVAVDGYLHPGGSPHEITFKAAGRYTLTVSKPGFKPVEMLLTLDEGERTSQTIELVPDDAYIDAPFTPPRPPQPPLEIPVDPPAGAFTLNVTSVPSGATVTIREPGATDRRDMGLTPIAIALSPVGATEVVVSKAGYQEHRRLVVAPEQGDQVDLDVALATRAVPGPRPLDDPPLIIDDPPIVSPPGSTGFISVNTNPWTAVVIDGKAVGNTPLVNFKVSAGYHTVLMENRDLGKRRKKAVNVRPGEHVRLMESL